jgi:hypothetical protein
VDKFEEIKPAISLRLVDALKQKAAKRSNKAEQEFSLWFWISVILARNCSYIHPPFGKAEAVHSGHIQKLSSSKHLKSFRQ